MEKVLKFNETLKTGQEIEMLLTVRTPSECRTVNEAEALEIFEKMMLHFEIELICQIAGISAKEIQNLLKSNQSEGL